MRQAKLENIEANQRERISQWNICTNAKSKLIEIHVFFSSVSSNVNCAHQMYLSSNEGKRERERDMCVRDIWTVLTIFMDNICNLVYLFVIDSPNWHAHSLIKWTQTTKLTVRKPNQKKKIACKHYLHELSPFQRRSPSFSMLLLLPILADMSGEIPLKWLCVVARQIWTIPKLLLFLSNRRRQRRFDLFVFFVHFSLGFFFLHRCCCCHSLHISLFGSMLLRSSRTHFCLCLYFWSLLFAASFLLICLLC